MEAIIISIMGIITSLVKVVGDYRTAAQQKAEWTPELEVQYQTALKATATAPEWQPDAKE